MSASSCFCRSAMNASNALTRRSAGSIRWDARNRSSRRWSIGGAVSLPFSNFPRYSEGATPPMIRFVRLAEDAVPIPADQLLPVRVVLPGLANLGKNGGKRDNLRLVREIEDSVDVQHMQELGGLQETALDLRLVGLVRLKRQIEQCLAVA